MTTDPESTTILQQAEALAKAEGNRLGVSVTTDGQRVDGTLSVSHSSDHWWMRLWAIVTGRRGEKPKVTAGVQGGVRWLRGRW